MSRLNQLAHRYGSDKSDAVHNYTPHYADLFAQRETVVLVVEIGVQRGGSWQNNHPTPSLKMWQEYFYNARVIGFDLKDIEPNEPNIEMVQGNQANPDDLARLVQAINGEADLIIDDGSHRPDDQLFTFEYLRDYVKPGGYYVIEDCNARIQSEYHESERIINTLRCPKGWSLRWESSQSAGKQSLAILQRLT